MSNDTFAQKLIKVRPHPRQIAWQQKEWIAFFHFSINTFTNNEWGAGNEDIALFHPGTVDTDQWCRIARDAGMKGVILTAKHHDGFCLWDTKYTDHNVMRAPYGRDIVRQLSNSCKQYGLALGLYLSPWDRHEPSYGSGEAYNDFFCAQLTELLTQYGELFEVWFDGACGEGPNGKVQQYDWNRIYALIRAHQPDACIAICGPDVRWCGNEAGAWRESEWSVVPASLRDCEKVQEASQQTDDIAFREAGVRSMDLDLGSRAIMEKTNVWSWYPAEVNTSIRPGWFYHPQEDDLVKPVDWLVDLYEHTVGGNAVLLLNIPPDTHGRIHPHDEAALLAVGQILRERYARDLATGAMVLQDDDHTRIRLRFEVPQAVSRVIIEEDIQQSQRIERFKLFASRNGEEKLIYEGTTVGYRKICAFDAVIADELRLKIEHSRCRPAIKRLSAY